MVEPSKEERVPAYFPERVGRYELLVPIGSGGMATVYLARVRGPEDFERDVALKLLHPHLRDDAQLSRELMDEARIAARIRHANVVQVLDVGDDPAGIFLCMEYVEGLTLAGLRRVAQQAGEPVPFRIALRVVCDALAGLHAAHELTDASGEPLDVVHRDFSPQNILVGVDGTSRLADFGIAKAAGRLAHTRTGLVKGKVGYMSPEQVRASPIDRRTDVWAAGVIVWEFFTKRRLFPGDDVPTLLKIASETAPRLSEIDPDAPKALDEVVAEALTVDPEKRIASAEALRRRLLAAWREVGTLPDSAEVAEYVSSVGAARLTDRRKRVGALLQERTRKSSSDLETQRLESERTSEPSGRNEPVTTAATAREVAQTGPIAPKLPRRWAVPSLIVVGGGAALALVLALAWHGSGGARASASTRGSASSPASAVSGTSDRELQLAADAPIGQIRVGSRVIAIDPPAPTVTIRLGATEPNELEAVAADGRHVELQAPPGEGELAVRFRDAPAPTPVPTSSAAPAPPEPLQHAAHHVVHHASPEAAHKRRSPLAPSPYSVSP
jgi:eukaryotic-like serine/threonine-protein kinase